VHPHSSAAIAAIGQFLSRRCKKTIDCGPVKLVLQCGKFQAASDGGIGLPALDLRAECASRLDDWLQKGQTTA
jgi:hypothetical protein